MTNRRIVQQPNRMTSIFGAMKEVCPQHIQAYAQCVMMHQKKGTLDHGSCHAEFHLVKQCFRNVRLKKG